MTTRSGVEPGSAARRIGGRALRVCLDVNVWIAFLIARSSGRDGTAAASLVDGVSRGKIGGIPIQLVLSHELLDTLARVLTRQGFGREPIDRVTMSVTNLGLTGPERLDPALLLAGRDQLAMHDREDAGILATCLAARANLLVTDNLRDFVTNDSERIETRTVRYADGNARKLFALVHGRNDGVTLVVMHPLDAIEWLQSGVRPDLDELRRRYGPDREALL